MKQYFFRYVYLFFFILACWGSVVFAEGTKELMPDQTQKTWLLIARGTVQGQARDPFAVYGTSIDEAYRLCIHIENPATEKIYFGLGLLRGSSVASNGWRIQRPDAGNSVIFQANIPTSGIGYINSYLEASSGPSIINPNGYSAQSVQPDIQGDYFMTFEINSNTSRTFDYFDITVVNTLTNQPIPGRVYSKNWQIATYDENFNLFYFKALMFIYTNDKIVTQLNPNGFDGRHFSFASNESGCYPISGSMTAEQARKSVSGRHTYPQFKVFLNIPNEDSYEYGTLGTLLPPPPETPELTVTTHCETGTIDFTFQVSASGTAEVTLQLSQSVPPGSPPYTNITVPMTVVAGYNTITWDGYDNSIPRRQIPNGSSFPFTLKYINGLTHLPLYDVENNSNGFIVTLVKPPSANEPKLYWDDSGLSGTSNFTGCQSSLGACHPWNITIGDQNTINTWWYVANQSTSPAIITEERIPAQPVAITGPTTVCQGSTPHYSIPLDPNSELYHWSWPGGEVTTSENFIDPDLNSVTPGPGQIISVYGINNTSCQQGLSRTLTIEIQPIPDLTTALSQSVCSGIEKNISLTSSFDPGVTYTWTRVSCSPEITAASCPPAGPFTTNLISVTPSVNGMATGTITYHITPSLSSCQPSNPSTLILTVSPLPDATTTPGPNSSLCSGLTTNISLASTFPSTTFSWSAPVCSNISVVPPGGGGNSITNTLSLTSNSLPGSADYSIIPNNAGCIGNTIHHFVTVNPSPVPQINGSLNFSVCQGVQETYTTEINMSGYSWTVSAGGTPMGPLNTNTLTVRWDAVGARQVSVTYTNENGCSPVAPTTQNVTVKPIPNVKTSPVNPFSVCSGETFGINLSSDVAGTETNTIFTWTVSGNGATLTPNPSGIPPTTGNISRAFSNSGNILEPLVFHIMPEADGCSPALPTDFTVNVNPVPAVATYVQGNPSTGQGLCSGTPTQAVSLQTNVIGLSPAYAWTNTCEAGITACPPSSGSSNPISAFTPGNATTTPKNIIYTIGASVNATSSVCNGPPVTYTIQVNPLPVTSFSGTTTVCQDYPTKYLYPAGAGPACTYTWSINPSPYGTIDNPAAATASIKWIMAGMASLQLNAVTFDGCSSSSSQLITVNAKPGVTLSACFDEVTTTNAKPFLLRGGKPLGNGGKYFVDGIEVSGGLLNPSTLSATTHTVSFTYTDANTCVATDSRPLTVGLSNAGYACYNNLFTDPRNNNPATNKYPTTTVTANGRTTCWMLKNLNWGDYVSADKPQTDNCVVEKYCPSNDLNCTSYGALYQWDEVMQYGSTPGWSKGVCPPGWHIPTATEWQDLIDANQGNGIAGGALKDLTISLGFKGLLNGMLYFNNIWAFTASDNLKASMFWTSSTGTSYPIARGINSVNPSVSYYETNKANAFPVRCVKD